MTGAMLGFPGEDYTTPQTIKETGGFGNPALRAERIERLKWAIHRTMALGLSDLSLHAGFLPAQDEPGRSVVLEALAEAGNLAAARGITLAFETGQETACAFSLHNAQTCTTVSRLNSAQPLRFRIRPHCKAFALVDTCWRTRPKPLI